MNRARACAAILFTIILVKRADGTEVDSGVKKYCREAERLVTSDEIDEYLLVDVEINSTVILECKFCDDKNSNHEGKIWHWQDGDQLTKSREVDLDMNNNASLNRISTTVDFSLMIRRFLLEDAGIYRCFGVNGNDENKWNYRLEPVFEKDSLDDEENGNIKDWEKYRERNLVPVTQRFSTSNMKDFVAIRQAGIKLEVVSEWGSWTPCTECKDRQGIKTKRAFCRIKRIYHKKVEKDSSVMSFFKTKPLIPCRSIILQNHYPTLGNSTRVLPEFILTESCKHCKKSKKGKRKKFKYKKRYVLAEGAHIVIPCPESTVDSDVTWRKESLLLAKGEGHSFRKKDPEPRVLVDIYYSIYLKDVSEDEQGNYACYVDGERMMRVKIDVVMKSKFFNGAVVRHLIYLSFVLLMVFSGYCIGVIKACRNRNKFKTYQQLKQHETSPKGS